MNLSTNGKNISAVKVITPEGFLLAVNGKDYFLNFKDHPYFRQIPVEDIFDVQIDSSGDLRWDKYDIDLCEEIIRSPENYPLIMQTPSAMGRKGGSIKSEVKARASRLNGIKGGRPKKKLVTV